MTEIYISITLDNKLSEIKKYLKKHGIDASSDDVFDAAITLAKRMGAGNWSFVCELKHRKE